jgi:hypothetical protein
MKFVVKATVSGSASEVGFLSEPDAQGQRTIIGRGAAAIFESRRAAHEAISRMPVKFEQAGLLFSVEPYE